MRKLLKSVQGVATYQNLLRFGGFAGLMYLLLTKDHPDPTLIFALLAMMGLPTFIDRDMSARRKKRDDEE